ncbi:MULTISPECIES: hypothetical protein [unclassified Lebetimonas]|uniref:hypothetical protein n=1 Tax=unclassified Lebetimonas TaxID=2648158 RepID=UPI0004651AD4|nr:MULTISPECIES: hypothetical protein [unclassified Lebetimonas]
MDAVKEYWSDKTFLLGMFLCIIGTLLGAVGVVAPAVLIELTGIILMIVVIYKIDRKNEITY